MGRSQTTVSDFLVMIENSGPGNSPPKPIEIQAAGDAYRSRRGEASEAAFLARATSLNFCVAVPWGNSRPFDNLVQFGRIFWRVQVKSATAYHSSQYIVKAGSKGHYYTKDDIDFIAGHAVPDNAWYIVPVEAFEGRTELHFSPHCTGHSKYEKYREAWCLLACEPKARGWQDVPVICRSKTLGHRCAVCPQRG